jgi:hypothetical protein
MSGRSRGGCGRSAPGSRGRCRREGASRVAEGCRGPEGAPPPPDCLTQAGAQLDGGQRPRQHGRPALARERRPRAQPRPFEPRVDAGASRHRYGDALGLISRRKPRLRRSLVPTRQGAGRASCPRPRRPPSAEDVHGRATAKRSSSPARERDRCDRGRRGGSRGRARTSPRARPAVRGDPRHGRRSRLHRGGREQAAWPVSGERSPRPAGHPVVVGERLDPDAAATLSLR